MSSFIPLNLTEDNPQSKKNLEEEHSKELQVEEALRLYQQGLELQSLNKFKEAYLIYENIFNIDIIANHYVEEESFIRGIQNGDANANVDTLNFIASSIKSLRYMVFKNRGFLYFNILKSGIPASTLMDKTNISDETLEEEERRFLTQIFYGMLDDFLIALIYEEGDEDLMCMLFNILAYLGISRLTRFTLEYILSAASESDEVYALFPVDKNLIKCLTYLLHKLKILRLTDVNLVNFEPKINEQLHFLKPFRDEYFLQSIKINEKLATEFEVESKKSGLSWSSVVDGINKLLKSKQDTEKARLVLKSKSKDVDPYLLTSCPVEYINLKIKHEEDNPDQRIDESVSLDKQPAETENNLFNEFDLGEKESSPLLSYEKSILENESMIDEEGNEMPQPNREQKDFEVEDCKNKSIGNEIPSNVPHRSSKRFKNREDNTSSEFYERALTKDLFSETELFFQRINHYFSKCENCFGCSIQVKNVVEIFMASVDSKEMESGFYGDYLSLLNDWKSPAYSRILEVNGSSSDCNNYLADDEKIKLMEILGNYGERQSFDMPINLPSIDEAENHMNIKIFLDNAHQSNFHIVQIRYLILKRLVSLVKDGDNYLCLLTDTIWDTSLFDKVKEWIFQTECSILEFVESSNDERFHLFSMAVGIYEILVDSFLDVISQLHLKRSRSNRGTLKSSKSQLSSLAVDSVKLYERIERWAIYIGSCILDEQLMDKAIYQKVIIRFKWAQIYMENSNSTILKKKKFLISKLNSLLEMPDFQNDESIIYLPNYSVLNHISRNTIKSLLIKVSVISILAKVLYIEEGDNSTEAITLLENILIGSSSENKNVSSNDAPYEGNGMSVIKKFLKDANVDMKLGVWNILFSYYDQNKKFDSFQYGFENYLQYIISYLNSEKYRAMEKGKYESLLKILGSYGKHLSTLVSHLSNQKWSLKFLTESHSHSIPSILSNLITMFELFYLFSLHEEASIISSSKISLKVKSERAYEIFKTQFINTLIVLFVYFKSSILMSKSEMNQYLSDSDKSLLCSLISEMHEQLGWRRLCEAANGLFLTLVQDTLVNFGGSSFNDDLAQLINCRYHYKLSIDKFSPISHDTNHPLMLDQQDAKIIADFILPLCFRSNPMIYIPKSDLKTVVDDIYQVIGLPEPDTSLSLKQNKAMLERFLETTSLTKKFFRDCFRGYTQLYFLQPDDNRRDIVQKGLFFLEGLLIFSSYKIRKKSTQSRAVELENVIMLLQYDLLYNPNRMESWFLLGQAYSFLVEDDLIWTSDKLTVPERKATIANTQRKSLICYSMALNYFSTLESCEDKKVEKTIIALLSSTFAKDLYGAVMKPMDMEAFRVYNVPILININGNPQLVSEDSFPKNFRLYAKIIQQLLHLSIKSNPGDWAVYYYLAKIQLKLELDPYLIFETIGKSIELAQKVSTPSDPISEPYYKLCSILYKFIRDDKVKIEQAKEILLSNSIFKLDTHDRTIEDKFALYELIMKSLRKLIQNDKKKWHHKPRYLLSKILFYEYKNIEAAKQEMSSIISIKSSNKTLVQIWKPENERPGKHFYYTYQYALFFFTLLVEERNLRGMIQMLPRLRRSNSIMVSLTKVWEFVCSSICKLIREISNIDDSFTETFMAPISFQKFVSKSKLFINYIKENEVPGELLMNFYLLNSIVDMKKLNNGFGPTSLIDDTMISIYVKSYTWLDNHEAEMILTDPLSEATSSKDKKLAKRDFFPIINEIIKAGRKDIEKLSKERIDALSHYSSGTDQNSYIPDEPKTYDPTVLDGSHASQDQKFQSNNDQLETSQQGATPLDISADPEDHSMDHGRVSGEDLSAKSSSPRPSVISSYHKKIPENDLVNDLNTATRLQEPAIKKQKTSNSLM